MTNWGPCSGTTQRRRKEWGALGSWDLVPSAINYENKINSRTVQGGRTGARARQEEGEVDGGMGTLVEAQRGRVRTLNIAARLVGQPGQVVVPVESREYVSAHGI